MKNHDGAIFCMFAHGGSHREEDNPNNSIIDCVATAETNDKRFLWMNNKVAIGRGKKEGKTVRVNYYIQEF